MTVGRAWSERIEADGVAIELHHVVGGEPGPVLALLGGVHGDELEGVAAVRMVLGEPGPAVVRGELRAVAIANPAAFAARSRTSPVDGGNLARLFPGNPGGTPTERLAYVLTRDVIRGSDLVVDMHSAGNDYAMPWFVGYVASSGNVGDRSAEAARQFGAPCIWQHDVVNPGRSLSAASDLGIPAIYVEGGGGATLRRAEVRGYVEGVYRLMAWMGMTDRVQETEPGAARLLRGGAGDVDASVSCSASGWCMVAVRAGDPVDAGSLVAEITGEDGRTLERIVAPRAGTVMMLRRRAEVCAGDSIAMFGPMPA